jgi:hypothetical protein
MNRGGYESAYFSEADMMRRHICSLILLALTACTAENDRQESESFPVVLADSWVRFYPPTETPDTLILLANGTVRGSTAGIDDHGFAMTHWQIADTLMLNPGAFCIGTGWRGTVVAEPLVGSAADTAYYRRPQTFCQGYALIGDTLALANQNGTVFVRASAAANLQQLRRRFDNPDGPRLEVAAPHPGAEVRGVRSP